MKLTDRIWNFVKAGYLRFKSKTPVYLKKLQKIFAFFLLISGTIIGLKATGNLDLIDPIVWKIAQYMSVGCTTAITALQFGTTDKTLQNATTTK